MAEQKQREDMALKQAAPIKPHLLLQREATVQKENLAQWQPALLEPLLAIIGRLEVCLLLPLLQTANRDQQTVPFDKASGFLGSSSANSHGPTAAGQRLASYSFAACQSSRKSPSPYPIVGCLDG